MLALTLSDGGHETPCTTFERDQLAICAVGAGRHRAVLRVWRAATEYVSIGRYHRNPGGAPRLVRRLTGGRALNLGPGVVSLTMVLPSFEFLAFGRGAPAPDQVLNRALRPLLGTLREAGVDAFYPGRDLVTWQGAAIAVASFTSLPDGIVVVEAHVAVTTPFAKCASLLSEADPERLIPHDARAFADGVCLSQHSEDSDRRDWVGSIGSQAASVFGGEVIRIGSQDGCFAGVPDAAAGFDALQRERGPMAPDWCSALGIEMLGAVEVAARVEAGRMLEFGLFGDIIAPFQTLEEIAAACEGETATRAASERALLSVLMRPENFLLGVRDFGALVERLA